MLPKIKTIAEKAKNQLIESVNKNLYERRDPTTYERTYQLVNSITLSDIKIDSTGKISFEIFFDNSKMHHTSVVSGTEYWNGKKINVPYLVNDGHYNSNGSIPWFDDYPGAFFIEDSIEKIRQDIKEQLYKMINLEIKRIGDYKYRG